VSCSSPSFCVALGQDSNQATVSYTFDGSSWSGPATVGGTPAADNTTSPTTVSCPEQGFCVGGLDNGSTYVLENGSWNPSTHLAAGPTVTCTSSRFCMAEDGIDHVATFNGSSWSGPVSIGAGVGDGAVSCASPSFCADVGGGSASQTAYTFTGGAWKGPANIGSGDNNLESVSCVPSGMCVAVGESAKGGFVESTYKGGSWSAAAHILLGSGDPITTVSCASATFCVAVGVDANIGIYDGNAWQQVYTPDSNDAVDVSCPTTSFCMAVGGHEAYAYQS
jgi:hypothetical protein